MRTLVVLLPALGCTAMMLFVCLPMMRGKNNAEDKSTREEMAALRDEVARLRPKTDEAQQTYETVPAAKEPAAKDGQR
jgi:hypothetical protein